MSAVANSPIASQHDADVRSAPLPQGAASTRKWAGAFAALIIACGVGAIVKTYPVFTQTSDEPAHIACGLQLLTFHQYTYEPQHPPLARVMAALPLYLSGARADDQLKMWPEGNAILARNGQYRRNLTLARIGILPFYVLACLFAYLLASSFYNTRAALATVALFASCPLVLAHAGLATTDIAVTAGFAAALYAFVRWRHDARWATSLGLAVAIAFGLLTKFSFLPFFLLTSAAFLIVCRHDEWKLRRGLRLQLFAVSLLVVTLVWAGYGFSLTTLHAGDRAAGVWSVASGWRLPLLEFAKGIAQLSHHFQLGHPSYLLGRTSMHGFPAFFLVALLVKTPLPFLILVVAGVSVAAREHSAPEFRGVASAAIASALILLFTMTSSVTIGLRHILPVMVLLAIVAAYPLAVADQMSQRSKIVVVAASAILISLQLFIVGRQAPDYLSYFNAIAGPKPERVLVDSDLDWGQDLGRLQEYCTRHHVDRLSFAYFGSADVHLLKGVEVESLAPNSRAIGWVAISKSTRHLSMAAPGVHGTGREYTWLDRYSPVGQVGSSIDVYFIPDTQ